MSSEALLLAERNVPRYTSYPTAPHFNTGVTAATYSSWLSDLSDRTRLSLYFHVPFCRELCFYCGCHTQAVQRQQPIDEYTAALKAEIAILAQCLQRQPISQVHWGGGTPSLLAPRGLLGIAETLNRTFDFTTIREHAIELDPRYVSPELVDCLVKIGVNRASLGVQDLSPHVQHAIGRIQPYDTVARAVDLLRSGGVEKINFDLMYGLPCQTSEDVRSTAERICTLRPQRIALFGYAHVPWFKKRQRLIDSAQLPDLAGRSKQMEVAREVFLSSGYQTIGFDHFALMEDDLSIAARTGCLHRNFQGYTADDADALIGLGASAIGRLPRGYVQNAPDISGYARAVRSGSFATIRGIALTADDRLRAYIIERIMCDLHVDLRAMSSLNPGCQFESEISCLEPFAAQGLVHIDAGELTIGEAGRPYVRLIAAAFDTYLAANAQGHSRAI